MNWQSMVAGALAVVALGACGNDDDKGAEKGAEKGTEKGTEQGTVPADGFDQGAYCALVKEAVEREQPGMPGLEDELTPESAQAIDEEFSRELAFTEKIAAAAPEDLRDEWQSLVDVQAAVVDKGRKFLDPDFMSEYQAMSEDERLEYFFTEILGPFEDLDEKDLAAIGAHAETECAITGLFDDAGA